MNNAYYKADYMNATRFVKLINADAANAEQSEFVEVFEYQEDAPVIRLVASHMPELFLFGSFSAEISAIKDYQPIEAQEFYQAYDRAAGWLRSGTTLLENSFLHNQMLVAHG
jgi:hypothetical protein